MAHSLNSPSSFAKRRACPASAEMERPFPESTSEYAAEGTAAHELGEKCLKTGKNPADFLGQKMGEFTDKRGNKKSFIVDGDMVEAVETYVNHCRELMKEGVFAIEQKFSLPFIGKDEKGTSDFTAISQKTLHVVDYKHGQGVAVDVEENEQGLCYGQGAAEQFKDYEWDKLTITIVQPRAWHREGKIRSWSVDREDLINWELQFSAVAELTRAKNPPMQPSDYCRWCKASFQCKGIVEFIKEVTGMDILNPNGNTPIDYRRIPEEQLTEILFDKLPIIEKWIHAVKDYAQSRAEERKPLPGTKLVETRAVRKWADEQKAEQMFGQFPGAYEKKFKSAPQMEKLLGAKKFAEYEGEYVKKISTGVTLVRADDPRPSARPSGASEFSAVNLFGD